MCDIVSKCTAVSDSGSRCGNPVMLNSNHCAQHHLIAKKLYLKYKKICEIAYRYDIQNSSNILGLMKCYANLNKAFDARMAHRRYAFVPECHDIGHDYQFELIQNKIKLCEEKLAILYQEQSVKINSLDTSSDSDLNSNSNSNSSPKSDPTNKANQINQINPNVPKKIKQFRKKRDKSEIEINDYMDACIAENKMLGEKKINFLVTIFDIVQSYTSYKIHMSVFLVATYKIVAELASIKYFDKNFRPQKCACKECKRNITYIIKLFCGCGCVIPKQGSVIPDDDLLIRYLLDIDDTSINKFHDSLITNKDKIQPIINDLAYEYETTNTHILLEKYELSFDDKADRLVLKPINLTRKMRRKLI